MASVVLRPAMETKLHVIDAHLLSQEFLSHPLLNLHDLVWQFEASIISSLKGDALALVEGDDDTPLPFSRDLPKMDAILD